MPLYLKGYRLDDDKIAKRFDVENTMDLDYVEHTTRLKFAILRRIDPDSYRYIGSGFERNGCLNVIIVTAGGNDAVALTEMPMPPTEDRTLLDIARKVCTPGVWPSYDDVDNPLTFWDEWDKNGVCHLGEMKEAGMGRQLSTT